MTRPWAFRLARVLLVAGLSVAARPAHGHSLNTALLSLTEVEDGRFLVRWQASSYALDQELAAPAEFPAPCRFRKPYLDCGPSGLVGSLKFPWLEGSETSLMVDIEWRSETRLLRVIKGSDPSLVVYGISPSAGLRSLTPIMVDYTGLGIEHILTGYDHLLFVLALALLVRKGRRLVASITAFTVAHSLTLACAVLGLLRLPILPVEAAISLSIVLVCGECLRATDSLARHSPWIVAFAFGLLHGLGFASALLAIGLPEKHVPTALLFFNVGVELGQLGVIALAFALRALVARLRLRPEVGRGLVYAMGTIAAYWSVDRILRILTVFTG
jgi:hydrogenase/urease accessory protein HupE